MVAVVRRFFAPAVACLVLSACGGGGGGGAPLTLRLTPGSVDLTVQPGQPETFVVDGTVSGQVDGIVNVLIVDGVGVIEPDVQIVESGDGYRATFTTAGNLAPDTYRGSITVRLCGGTPPGCSPEYGRASLGYVIEVLPVPLPVIAGIAPAQSLAGTSGFTLTVTGSNFFPGSQVQWDGEPLGTVYVSPTTLRATVNAEDLRDGGARAVTVATPLAAVSAGVTHTVINPAPVLAAVSPAATTAGCGSFTLTAIGSGFVESSVVQWQGTPLATGFVSSTRLRAVVPAGLIASPATSAVTVVSPPAGGGSTPARSVTVNATSGPASQAVTLQVDPGHTAVAHTPCPDTPSETPLWDVALGGTSSYPLIADGRIFVAVSDPPLSNETVLRAYDAATGAALWGPVVVAGDAGFFGRADIAYANGTVFVAANQDPALPIPPGTGTRRPGSVQAYAATDGALRWRAPLEQNGTATDVVGPVPANGRVYVSARTAVGTLQAFDQVTGNRDLFIDAGSGSARWPAVSGSTVVLTTPCDTSAFDAATGASLWLQAASCSTGNTGIPVVADGVVYSVTGTTESPDAYLLADGSPLGTYPRDGIPAITDGVAVTTTAFRMRAVDLATSTELWRALDRPPLQSYAIGPLVVNGVAIAGNLLGASVVGVDTATGLLAWELPDVGASQPSFRRTSMQITAGENRLVVSIGTRLVAFRIGGDPQ